MKKLLLLLLLWSSACVASAQNLVIVLSWDGMRHDFPDLGEFKALQAVEARGVRASRLTPVYPSATFPGHVSLATGAPPNIHGILDNRFTDRVKGSYAYSSEADWIDAEPIWIAAERQGIKVATYFWVGSETDWRGQGTHYRIAPFDGGRPETEKVIQIIEWIDLPVDERPQLIMSYWAGADSVAHYKGPDHADVITTIEGQDANLQTLIAAIGDRALWPTTTLIIVSDHGMANVNETVEVQTAIEKQRLPVRVAGGNAVQHLFVDDPSATPALLALLQQQPNIRIFSGDEIPATLQYPNRTGDVVITTEPPYSLSRNNTFTAKALAFIGRMLGWHQGAHGYSPDHPDMGGIFLAMGRGVTPNKTLGEVNHLQVAPTIAALLGIEPPTEAKALPIELQ